MWGIYGNATRNIVNPHKTFVMNLNYFMNATKELYNVCVQRTKGRSKLRKLGSCCGELEHTSMLLACYPSKQLSLGWVKHSKWDSQFWMIEAYVMKLFNIRCLHHKAMK